MIVRYSNKSCLTKILTSNVLISCISLQFFCQTHVLGFAFSFKVLQSPPGNFITALKFTSHARHIRLRICDSLTTCNQQMRVLMQSLQPVDKDTQRPHNSPHKYTYKHEGTHHLLINTNTFTSTNKKIHRLSSQLAQILAPLANLSKILRRRIIRPKIVHRKFQ